MLGYNIYNPISIKMFKQINIFYKYFKYTIKNIIFLKKAKN